MDDATGATGQDTTGRDATGHDATGRDATPTMVVSVADAAALLGISPGAVRKRIERGQLGGRKTSGQWEVLLNPDDLSAHDATRRDATGHDATSTTTATLPRESRHDGHDATGRDATRRDGLPIPVSDAARAQLAAIRDEFVGPLVARIEEQAERIGRLEAERDRERADREAAEQVRDRERDERDRIEQERDALRAEVERMRVVESPFVRPQEVPGRAEPPVVASSPSKPLPWWRRWLWMER